MRKRANLKQFELADLLKVERSTIAKRASQLPELAKVLDCTIDELYQPPEEST